MTRSKKRIFSLVLALAVMLAVTVTALAASTPGSVTVSGGSYKYTVAVGVGSTQFAVLSITGNSAGQPLVISAYNSNTYLGDTIVIAGAATAKYLIYNDGTVTTTVGYSINVG